MRVTIIDTCCLINLYASQRLPAIVSASIDKAFVPHTVLSECLYIRQPSVDNPSRLVPANVDLHPLIGTGILLTTDLTGDAELDEFVQLAAVVDDCEAVCLSIAAVRGWGVATDDRHAIRVAMDLGVSFMTTPQMLKNWAEHSSIKRHEVTDAIMSIEKYGRFRPHSACPYAGWWAQQRLA